MSIKNEKNLTLCVLRLERHNASFCLEDLDHK